MSKWKHQDVRDPPSGADLVVSDSCLLGYLNSEGARPMQHEEIFDPALLPITQDHDGGAAAAAKVRRLGHQELKVHWNRQYNFEWILCDLWKYQGIQFSTVVMVWAGNDLKWWMTPEELANAINSLKESCTKWQVDLRLIDVVGRSYF